MLMFTRTRDEGWRGALGALVGLTLVLQQVLLPLHLTLHEHPFCATDVQGHVERHAHGEHLEGPHLALDQARPEDHSGHHEHSQEGDPHSGEDHLDEAVASSVLPTLESHLIVLDAAAPGFANVSALVGRLVCEVCGPRAPPPPGPGSPRAPPVVA